MIDYPTGRGTGLLLAEAGLYAAGATTAGLEGGTGIGYVGGLVKSTVTGCRAGDWVAKDLAGTAG